MNNATTRFSDRAENYVKYRPGYPDRVVGWLEREGVLGEGNVIADVGAGTGLSAEVFLKKGYRVIGIEPNRPMREAGEAYLAKYPGFTSGDGMAEKTGLGDAAVDMVLAGQAFHWFDRARAVNEFRRILRPGGWVVLMWNERLDDATPFLREYERLLREHSAEYGKVDHRRLTQDVIREAIGQKRLLIGTMENEQRFDWEGVLGRLMSSSYAPKEGDAAHRPLVDGLRRAFESHQEEGKVRFEYQTRIYAGLVS